MLSGTVFVGLVLGAAIGYLLSAHRMKDELSRERVAAVKMASEKTGALGQLQTLQQERAALEEDLTKTKDQLQTSEHNNVRVNAELRAEQDKQKSAEEQARLLEEGRRQLKQEFENLANKIFEDKGKTFSEQSKTTLESLLKPFGNQITEFRKRVDEVHTEATKANSTIEAEIKKVVQASAQLSDEASNLTTALKGDKKTTGNWGEVQLEKTLQLAGLVSGDHYESQAAFKDAEGNRRHPDFVLKLPDGKHMVIDSKVSLVDYDAAIAAETEEDHQLALEAHTRAVRKHIDDLSSKDYSSLVGMHSPNFVLMFMAIEPAYIEAMKHNRDLFNYGYGKGVIMVSHTTLMPILRTVTNLWMIEKSNAEARELGDRAGDIYNQVCRVAKRLGKLGGSLGAVTTHYNDTLKSLSGQQGLIGKVDRFRELSSKATQSMDEVQPLHSDIETHRLEAIPAPPEDEIPELKKLS